MLFYGTKEEKKQTKTNWIERIRETLGEMRLKEEDWRGVENWRMKVTGQN